MSSERHGTADGKTCDCGAALVSVSPWMEETCVGFFSPPGHDHNDNCLKGSATCAAGHTVRFGVRQACPNPNCDWKGKAECWCHPGKKLDAMPVVEDQR